jgi:chitosanase
MNLEHGLTAMVLASVLTVSGCASAPKASSAEPTAVATPSAASPSASATAAAGLDDPAKKEIAMELVSSAENSSLDWKAQYAYIEDIKDGRGYTAGIIGFCSGTSDMLQLVQNYQASAPADDALAQGLTRYLPALKKVDGTASHAGLGAGFVAAWKAAAADPLFQAAQDAERDQVYFNPAVAQAKADGLGTLGQFVYYDAMVMHGPGDDPASFGGIRAAAMATAPVPSAGGDETRYLKAFFTARIAVMKTEEAHADTSRIDDAQRVFLAAGNLDLDPPLDWKTYGDAYHIP